MKKCAILGLLVTELLAATSAVRADVRLPAVVGSNMVLQRDMPLPIWGWADPGEKVTVTLGDVTQSATAGDNGRWEVKFPAMKAGGDPLSMNIKGKNSINLTNILIGEVWLGSGQSNMEWSVERSAKAKEEIAAAKHPKIRLFLVPLVPSGVPAETVNASWQECSPDTISRFSAVLYFFGREIQQDLDVPVGLIATSWGGTAIQPWIPPAGYEAHEEVKAEGENAAKAANAYPEIVKSMLPQYRTWLDQTEKQLAAGKHPKPPPNFPNHPLNSNGAPTGLYNGMIHPLVPFAIRGALWYQGESNRGQGMKYHTYMKALISGWRKVWGEGDFPFLFVQLAPYRYDQNSTALPEIWEAQTATLAVPNTGMAVTTDITTVNDIHPPNKQDVGKRLALWALANTYGKKDIVYSGPLFDSMQVEGDKIRIKFKHVDGGLVARDGKPLNWFAIAGEDKKFHQAQATIDGESVVVHSADVKQPVAVRFGWDQIAEPNLMNKAGLPASPFRTDKWTDAVSAAAPAK
ncbi:MAG TPA: sialate O-acetylesterase [Planctomycetaceae bacterium]|nr:sialate O-acetylesterase [Planctomycetaceae bacterium]